MFHIELLFLSLGKLKIETNKFRPQNNNNSLHIEKFCFISYSSASSASSSSATESMPSGGTGIVMFLAPPRGISFSRIFGMWVECLLENGKTCRWWICFNRCWLGGVERWRMKTEDLIWQSQSQRKAWLEWAIDDMRDTIRTLLLFLWWWIFLK